MFCSEELSSLPCKNQTSVIWWENSNLLYVETMYTNVFSTGSALKSSSSMYVHKSHIPWNDKTIQIQKQIHKSLWTHCVDYSVPTWGNLICGNLEMMPVSTRTSQMFGVEWMKPLKTAFSTQPLLKPRSGSAFLTLPQITLVTPRFHLKKNNKEIPYLCRHSRTASQYGQSQSTLPV